MILGLAIDAYAGSPRPDPLALCTDSRMLSTTVASLCQTLLAEDREKTPMAGPAHPFF